MRLFMDDLRTPRDPDSWVIKRSVKEAIEFVDDCHSKGIPIEEMALDHDMQYGCIFCVKNNEEKDSFIFELKCNFLNQNDCKCDCHLDGRDFLHHLIATGRWPTFKPTVHSANFAAAQEMRALILDHGPYCVHSACNKRTTTKFCSQHGK